MFGLSASLIVLETLPGWPAAPEPSPLESLALLLGLPAAIAAVFAVVGLAPGWFRSHRAGSSDAAREQ